MQFLVHNPLQPIRRPSLPSPLLTALRLCQDLDRKHSSGQRYSPVVSQTYCHATEGEKGQAASDSLNDHSILPEAKVVEMAASRTRRTMKPAWSLPLIPSFEKKKKNVKELKD